MRSLLRRTALALVSASVLLCLSCERHHPDELMPAQDGHQNEAAHAHGSGSPAEHEPAHAHQASSPAGSPAAARTPAEFFPTATATPH